MYLVTVNLSVDGVPDDQFNELPTSFIQSVSGKTPLDALSNVHDLAFLYAPDKSFSFREYCRAVRSYVISHDIRDDVVVTVRYVVYDDSIAEHLLATYERNYWVNDNEDD